jgi:hypothetical protein
MIHPFTRQEWRMAERAVALLWVLIVAGVALLAWWCGSAEGAVWLQMDGPTTVTVGQEFEVRLSIWTDWYSPFPHGDCLPLYIWQGGAVVNVTLDAWDWGVPDQGYVWYLDATRTGSPTDVATGPWSDLTYATCYGEPHWGYTTFRLLRGASWPNCVELELTVEPVEIATIHLLAMQEGIVEWDAPVWSPIGSQYANVWSEHPCEPQHGHVVQEYFAITVLPEAPPPPPGDCNADGVVDCHDINAFVAALVDGDLCADMNADGLADLEDINAFVALL